MTAPVASPRASSRRSYQRSRSVRQLNTSDVDDTPRMANKPKLSVEVRPSSSRTRGGTPRQSSSRHLGRNSRAASKDRSLQTSPSVSVSVSESDPKNSATSFRVMRAVSASPTPRRRLLRRTNNTQSNPSLMNSASRQAGAPMYTRSRSVSQLNVDVLFPSPPQQLSPPTRETVPVTPSRPSPRTPSLLRRQSSVPSCLGVPKITEPVLLSPITATSSDTISLQKKASFDDDGFFKEPFFFPGSPSTQRSPNPVIRLERSPSEKQNKRRRNSRLVVRLGTSNSSSESPEDASVTSWKRNSCSTKKSRAEALRERIHSRTKRRNSSSRTRRRRSSSRDLLPQESEKDSIEMTRHKLSGRRVTRSSDHRPGHCEQDNGGSGGGKVSTTERRPTSSGALALEKVSLDRFLQFQHGTRQSKEVMADNNEWDTSFDCGTWNTTPSNSLPVACPFSVDGKEESLQSQVKNESPGDDVVKAQNTEALFVGSEFGSSTTSANHLRAPPEADVAVEKLSSQAISLSLDDEPAEPKGLDGDESLEQVNEYIFMDPSGRLASYSGSVSKSSGMPFGYGRLCYPEEGEILNGKFVHNFWISFGRYFNTFTGEDYTGTLLKNVRHGHGKTIYPDGRVFEGTYNNGVKIEGKMVYQDGSSYVGQWANGARQGQGTYTFADGSTFFGEFEKDEMHGSGVLTRPDGARYVGNWKNGRRHGKGVEHRANGSIQRQGTWDDGAFVPSGRQRLLMSQKADAFKFFD